jgi:hypothetical protein
VVQEYEANPLADDSEDEKKLFKAESRRPDIFWPMSIKTLTIPVYNIN